MPTKTRISMPHLCSSSTPPGTVTPPHPWASCSDGLSRTSGTAFWRLGYRNASIWGEDKQLTGTVCVCVPLLPAFFILHCLIVPWSFPLPLPIFIISCLSTTCSFSSLLQIVIKIRKSEIFQKDFRSSFMWSILQISGGFKKNDDWKLEKWIT